MAEIVNLRQARKRAARDTASAKADANRIAFGLPKSLRTAAKTEQARRAAQHEGSRLDGRENAPEASDSPDGPATD